MTKKQKKQQEARDHLLKILKRGAVIYTVRKYRSGACRVFCVVKGEIWEISSQAARATSHRWSPKTGYVGSDCPFQFVTHLSWSLFSDTYALNHREL